MCHLWCIFIALFFVFCFCFSLSVSLSAFVYLSFAWMEWLCVQMLYVWLREADSKVPASLWVFKHARPPHRACWEMSPGQWVHSMNASCRCGLCRPLCIYLISVWVEGIYLPYFVCLFLFEFFCLWPIIMNHSLRVPFSTQIFITSVDYVFEINKSDVFENVCSW